METHVSLVGVNHSTAPVRFREELAVTSDRLEESLELLRRYVPSGVILSTCNRTEVYTVGEQPGEEAIINFLNALTGISFVNLLPHIYLRKNETAFGHLFRVASGLDSMILGEYEILGQINQALAAAEEARMVNLPLRQAFQSAIRTGRRVREETGISRNALSVSSVAVDLAAQAVGDLKRCNLMVIGAGEAGSLVAKVARERGAAGITVTNRTRERAEALAKELKGTAVDLENLSQELDKVSIVVSCTGAPQRILRVKHVAETMKQRAGNPLVIIDIAVPRDVEPAVKKINNVFLYDIDDLTRVSDTNRQQRESEIKKAKDIIASELKELASWWQGSDTRPIISALMQKAEEIRADHLKRTLKKLRPLSQEEQDNLEAMTRSIMTKILQDPIKYLKNNYNNHSNHNWDYAEMVRELFQLNTEND